MLRIGNSQACLTAKALPCACAGMSQQNVAFKLATSFARDAVIPLIDPTFGAGTASKPWCLCGISVVVNC